MRPTLLDHTTTNHIDETHRHAYNAAFHELGLSWHWDTVTYTRLQIQTHGRADVRTYLETEQSHLLRAYEADFLVNAIETEKARSYAGMTTSRTRPTFCPAPAGKSLSRMLA